MLKFGDFPCERQLDLMDCGPACLKMVAKYYGKYYSLQHLRDLCGISKEGVSMLGLSHAAERIGLRTLAARCSVNELVSKVPFPAIIHWNSSHFVVIYNIRKRRHNWISKIDPFKTNEDLIFLIADPAKGLCQYSFVDFEQYWLSSISEEKKGTVLILEPYSDFKTYTTPDSNRPRSSLFHFLSYFKSYKKNIGNLIIVMFLVTLMQAALPFISKAVIDVGIQTQDLDFINIVLIANVALIIFIMLSNVARDWILQHLTSRVNIALISDYLVKLMKLPINFFENKLIGDILQRANDHERIRSFIMNNSLNLIFSFLTFVIFGLVLLIYNSGIFYIFSIGSLIYVLWILGFLKMRRKLDWEYFEVTSKNQSYWVETIEAITDIKINNYEKFKRWKWEHIQTKLYKINMRSLNINNAQSQGAQFIDSLKNLFITFYCAREVIAGEITFGVMISTQFIIGMLNGPVNQFIQFVIAFQNAQISFLRLNEIHQLQNEDDGVGQNNIELPLKKDLVLNNVTFQYTPSSPPVLIGIRLRIPEGKITAIVGDSGSGKSTLIKLLLRLYKPTYGDIMIGDMNINNISLFQWREKCGAVMQDGKIFSDTILNNIVLDDEKVDLTKLKMAVETANITTEIERLPLGYQTKMGEQGRGLSGGQKQRILIARALYKNPDFLFFDEATNSLDTINEQKIVEALDEVFKGKTVIVVAHRLSTIIKADQIVVMQNGMAVEVGNHDSLLKKRGRYYQLIQTQSNLQMVSDPLPMNVADNRNSNIEK